VRRSSAIVNNSCCRGKPRKKTSNGRLFAPGFRIVPRDCRKTKESRIFFDIILNLPALRPGPAARLPAQGSRYSCAVGNKFREMTGKIEHKSKTARKKQQKACRYPARQCKSAGRTHEPQVVQDVENLYAGIFLKNRLRYRVAQN
jgi:hypothetical protein